MKTNTIYICVQIKHFTKFFKKLKINKKKEKFGGIPIWDRVIFDRRRPSWSSKFFSSLLSSQYPSALHTGHTSGPSALHFSPERARPSASLRSEKSYTHLKLKGLVRAFLSYLANVTICLSRCFKSWIELEFILEKNSRSMVKVYAVAVT